MNTKTKKSDENDLQVKEFLVFGVRLDVQIKVNMWGISNTKQAHLPWHFLKILKWLSFKRSLEFLC